jgi:hypothetical protein
MLAYRKAGSDPEVRLGQLPKQAARVQSVVDDRRAGEAAQDGADGY